MGNNFKKHAELLILDFLIHEADENHPASRPTVLKYIKDVYDVNMDRRTFYAGLDALRAQGAEISTYEDNHKGYYLKKRQFTEEEVMLLCMAVHNCDFIPMRLSNRLIHRLTATQSRFFQERYDDSIFQMNPLRGEAKTAVIALEVITQAIREKRNIRFYYRNYNFMERLNLRMGRKILDVNPLYIMYRYGNPYLVGEYSRSQQPCCFPLERIAGISIGDKTFKPRRHHLYPQPCIMEHTSLIPVDQAVGIRACADMEILDQIVESFGRELDMETMDPQHVILHFRTTVEDAVNIGERFIEHMEIMEPQDIRMQIRERVVAAVKKYE